MFKMPSILRKGSAMRALKLACATLATLAVPAADAQTWPARPIEMIIGFTAGGGVDIVGRAVAQALSERLGQNVVVVNRDGAGGTLGFGQLAAAAPDGYTLGFGPTTPISNAPYLVKGVKYQVDSFDYLCQVFQNVFSLAVNPNSPFKNAADLIAAGAKPDAKLTYGTSGLGSIPHLSVENFADALKLRVQHVPFRGDGALLPVLLKGDLDFAAPALSSIRGQNLRVLAVFANSRQPSSPDAPTAQELGVATSVPPGHNGLYAPKGLPAEIKAALEQGCAAAIKGPTIMKALDNTGMVASYLTGTAFRDQTVVDYTFKGELIKRIGLQSQ
jgi:tripartite-type tricarboxylate transporter receptor subunit TctC